MNSNQPNPNTVSHGTVIRLAWYRDPVDLTGYLDPASVPPDRLRSLVWAVRDAVDAYHRVNWRWPHNTAQAVDILEAWLHHAEDVAARREAHEKVIAALKLIKGGRHVA